MHNSIQKSLKMNNLLASTTHKISLATCYRYKPKSVKFQGKIPFCQSCCKKCQNVENIIEQASKYMANIPRDLGGCVDRTLSDYHGYFSNFKCVICKCKNCGSSKFLHQILESNADQLSDKKKCFLIKQWMTKTVRKEGATQSFLHWKFEKNTYEKLAH